MPVLEFDPHTNLLEQSATRYTLQDVERPNLFRHLFDYVTVPKTAFNHRNVPMLTPAEWWITDTTFRDGQQSTSPFTVDQIVHLFRPQGHRPPERVLHLHRKGPGGRAALPGTGL